MKNQELNKDYQSFVNLTFEAFKKLAKNQKNTVYEKIGFPDSYRKGYEKKILNDICAKLFNLNAKDKMILDIGSGCSELCFMLINLCRVHGHTLLLIDSQEMLDLLPDEKFVIKIPAFYPDQCSWLFEQYRARIDVILCYSVLHYIFIETDVLKFFDLSLSLLNVGGQMLIGDIPNLSMRKRFLNSEDGIKFHQQFYGPNSFPPVIDDKKAGELNDAILLLLLKRGREKGYHAYIVPQGCDLPMKNRREDLLVVRP